jgi:hypothetical protein
MVLAGHAVVFNSEANGGSYIQMKGRADRVPLIWKNNSWILRIHINQMKESKLTRQRRNHRTHRRWCHLGRGSMNLMHRRSMVSGFDYKPLPKAEQCKCSVCTTATSKLATAPKVHKTASRKAGAVCHVDFAVLPVESRNGNKLAALFTDEFTRYRQVWCAPTSASVHVALEQYCNTCEDRGYKLDRSCTVRQRVGDGKGQGAGAQEGVRISGVGAVLPVARWSG